MPYSKQESPLHARSALAHTAPDHISDQIPQIVGYCTLSIQWRGAERTCFLQKLCFLYQDQSLLDELELGVSDGDCANEDQVLHALWHLVQLHTVQALLAAKLRIRIQNATIT